MSFEQKPSITEGPYAISGASSFALDLIRTIAAQLVLVSGVIAETLGYGWLFAAAASLSACAAIVFLRSPAAVRAGMSEA